MKLQHYAVSLMTGISVLWASMSQADVITLQPKTVAAGGTGNYQDSFIGTDGSAVGSGATIGYIGALYSGSYQYEYIVNFKQLSSWIGGADKVTNATLRLGFYYPPTESGTTPPNLNVYRLTNTFQNGATWISRGGALGNWTTAGGDYDPTPVASLSFPTPPANFSAISWDVTGLVSNWVAGLQPNDGFLIKWTPSTSSTYYRNWYFSGPNGPAVSGSFIAPSLTFATIPEPSTTMLAELIAIGVAAVWRFRRP